MSSHPFRFLTLLAPLLICSPISAHDMWLVVERSHVAAGDKVNVAIAVGMDFPNSLNAISTERVSVLATDGTNRIEEFEFNVDSASNATVAQFQPPEAGLWIVGVTTRPNTIELESMKFNDYLLHDGMPHVLAGRMDRGELDRDAVEQYSKYTKTLVVVGDGAAEDQSGYQTPLGHKLEIVLLESPLQKHVGDTLRAQVLFEGKPLQGANLCWDHPGNGEAFTGQTWTDKDGVALIPLGYSGLMTLRLVHMTRPQTDSHEWESFWSSFTFAVDAH